MGSEKDVPCVFCGGNVSGTVWILCAACQVPAHKSCWDERGSCPVLDCGSKDVLDPAAALFRKNAPGRPAAAPAPTPPAVLPGAALPAVSDTRRELDTLDVAEAGRQTLQAKTFAVALAGWGASLVLATRFPVFYVLGAGWFLAFLSAAAMLEVQGWRAARRREELKRSGELPP